MKITASLLNNIIERVLQEQDLARDTGEWVVGTGRDVVSNIRGQDYPPHREVGLVPDEYDRALQYLKKQSGRPDWGFTPQEVRGAHNLMRMQMRAARRPASTTVPGISDPRKDPEYKRRQAPGYDAFKRDLYEIINEEVDKLL